MTTPAQKAVSFAVRQARRVNLMLIAHKRSGTTRNCEYLVELRVNWMNEARNCANPANAMIYNSRG